MESGVESESEAKAGQVRYSGVESGTGSLFDVAYSILPRSRFFLGRPPELMVE